MLQPCPAHTCVVQALLAPVRLLHAIIGNQAYNKLYAFLDAQIDIASTGTEHGALIASSFGAGIIGTFALIIARAAKT